MDAATAMRVLVIANLTAATPWLLKEIERRAKDGPCEFALLVPPVGGRHPDWTLDMALTHVEQAAGRRVQTVECDRDFVGAAQRALREQPFDEVLVSTRPPAGPKWLNPQPMRWLDDLQAPVTTVMLGERTRLERGVLTARWDDAP